MRNENIVMYELTARYDARASFYGKAKVLEREDGTRELYSYNTLVAKEKDGVVEVIYAPTQTTRRHIKEFKKQFER